jgi:hypothetical protein
MIEKFLNDQQESKAVEKVYSRLQELLPPGENALYIATQKKPLVNLLPDCVVITNRRVFIFTPANLGLSIKFVDFVWKDIAHINSKEELIGAVFSITTTNGAEMGVDYLPKVQARKLYQFAQECKENERIREEKQAMIINQGSQRQPEPEPVKASEPAPVESKPSIQFTAPAPSAAPEPPKPDELTEKLKKLKMLFDNGLISQEEYNQKKLELLSDF